MRKFYIFLFMIFSVFLVNIAIAGVAGDADGDGKVGLTDAVNALQVAAGVTTNAFSPVDTWKIIKIIEVENDDSENDDITCLIYKEGRLSKKVEHFRQRSSGNLYGEETSDFITNANNRIIYERGYSYYSHQMETTRYEYDVNGRLIALYGDNEDDGIYDDNSNFTYNSEDQITRIDSYEPPGTFEGYALLFYNNDGQISRWEEYVNDQLDEYGIFTYETDGRLTQESYYDPDNNLLGTTYYSCKRILSPSNAFNDYIYQLILN